jgi:hypothetical protein
LGFFHMDSMVSWAGLLFGVPGLILFRLILCRDLTQSSSLGLLSCLGGVFVLACRCAFPHKDLLGMLLEDVHWSYWGDFLDAG